MKVRILTAAGIIIVGVPILFFSQYIIFPIALGIFSLIASWEILRVLGMDKKFLISIPTYIMAALMPVFAHDFFVPADKQINYFLLLSLVLFAYLLYLIIVSVFSGGTLGYKNIASVFMMVAYIVIAFTSFSLLRYMNNGVYFYLMVFMGAWICDVFAYFVGMLFGKHKLAPVLSPKKTIEGAIGGVVFSVATFLGYGLVVESFFGLDANYIVLAILGFVLSIVSQIGDLWASLIKREYGIKDYSNILPGHGGMIDRFDSIFSTCTVLLVVCWIYPPFI